MRVAISTTWNGVAAGPGERYGLELAAAEGALVITVDAPFHDDPPPQVPPGPTPALWTFEVVELFLYGDGDRYLELEFGPHGHHLALQLDGVRRVVARGLPLEYTAQIAPDRRRWRGRARVPVAQLPPGLSRYNAHAIHGIASETSRRYLSAIPAHAPARDAGPDFHRPELAGPLEDALVRALAVSARRRPL